MTTFRPNQELRDMYRNALKGSSAKKWTYTILFFVGLFTLALAIIGVIYLSATGSFSMMESVMGGVVCAAAVAFVILCGASLRAGSQDLNLMKKYVRVCAADLNERYNMALSEEEMLDLVDNCNLAGVPLASQGFRKVMLVAENGKPSRLIDTKTMKELRRKKGVPNSGLVTPHQLYYDSAGAESKRAKKMLWLGKALTLLGLLTTIQTMPWSVVANASEAGDISRIIVVCSPILGIILVMIGILVHEKGDEDRKPNRLWEE